MPFYYKLLDDRVVGATATTSPGTGWTQAATLQAIFDYARSQNRPLFLRAGTYLTPPLTVTPSTGGANPLRLSGQVGTVLQLSANSEYILKIENVADVEIADVTFDGGGFSLTAASNSTGLLKVWDAGSVGFSLRRCTVRRVKNTLVAFWNVGRATVEDCVLDNGAVGIYSSDSRLRAERNTLTNMSDGGILVWRYAAASDLSVIRGNYIDGVRSAPGGDGQWGNGISLYRAGGVLVEGNTIQNCAFSAVRSNGGSGCRVVNNRCVGIGECCIFLEAPEAGLDLIGGVVVGNYLENVLYGINVVNLGLYGDGIARRAVVSSNHIANVGGGVGIEVEGDCAVTGNVVENAAQIGLRVGTNNATRDLAITGNVIRSTPLGIGYSATDDGHILITGNLISGYRSVTSISDPNYGLSGAIVPVSFDGVLATRVTNGSSPSPDHGNANDLRLGKLVVGNNSAHV